MLDKPQWCDRFDLVQKEYFRAVQTSLLQPCTAFHWGPLFSHLTSGGIDQYALGALYGHVHPVQTNILRATAEEVRQSCIRKFGLRKMVSIFRTVDKVYLFSYSLYVCKTCKQKFVLMFLESCEWSLKRVNTGNYKIEPVNCSLRHWSLVRAEASKGICI